MPLSVRLRSRASVSFYSLLMALLLTVLLILLLRNSYMAKNEASWGQQLGLVAHYVDDKIYRLDSALQRLTQSSDPCGKEAFNLQRKALIESPYVVDIFFLTVHGQRQCGSALQKLQKFDNHHFTSGDGIRMTRPEPYSSNGSSVFYIYRAIPGGGHVVAMVPVQILSSVLSQRKLPAIDGYMALVSSQDGTPLQLEPRQPLSPMVHSQLFQTPVSHYVSKLIDGYWVQAIPLLHSPAVSLVYVANRYQMGLLPMSWLGFVLAFFLLIWGGLYFAHGWWLRFDSHPGRTLRMALKRGEFFNVYQPIRNGESGELLGFEVLMRWRTAEGVIGPLHFISMAEQMGVLVAMTKKQIEQACSALAPLLLLQPRLKVSFNICSQHLMDASFMRDSAHWKLRIPHLVYEITEGERVDLDNQQISSALQRLRSLGIRLAVDDFGTGYSSLAYLQRMPLDILKADRCFVAALDTESPHAPILEAIVKLAHKLGLEIIAEGVEEESQVEWLLQHGVVQQQGWRHGKPLTIAEGVQQWQAELSGKSALSETRTENPSLVVP